MIAIQILPGTGFENEGATAFEQLRIVVPYTGWDTTSAALRAGTTLGSRLAVGVDLIAVQVIQFPCMLATDSRTTFLNTHMSRLAAQSQLRIRLILAVTRDCNFAYQCLMRPRSLVIVGARQRLGLSREERLARSLERAGHHVVRIEV
jgi:hypothetical protein